MADNHNNNNNNSDNDEIAVVPGTDEFGKMLFKLNTPVTEDNLGVLDYNGGHLQPVQDGLYAMPAYVNDDFNLFFIVSQLVENDWVIAFSTATIENDHEITDLSEPYTTGKGLNLLGQKSPEDANKLLKYFNTLAEANRGEWRMVERPDGESD
ncbi:hypothetical protein [Lentilactobacillus buchneri]|uniref:Uncharacterized protein n=1 Tax=Lentilactobacillus buchneri DSM 20057 TaxID=1423728 RepID=A0A4R5NR47_LENBU|nr:hypothetical protein [Lentilactobacillus buchneri]WCJ51674.1 hypothetical protein OKF32_10910 [Lentilactobacillus sp. Egmn17]AEB73235.1 hypothetical protein Lbuc_0976 [Lentilactobacillus buchneri NRRL B-30929]KRK67863.1 hypothetical protein FC79_GL001185 [Lentilactobacillus buchneri DSM 20057]MCT2882605.1 hypothetical protein [Lentilactobacillus buchneri]MCT2899190.1 hypothetical protein [Lentilactobacillus buchneri]